MKSFGSEQALKPSTRGGRQTEDTSGHIKERDKLGWCSLGAGGRAPQIVSQGFMLCVQNTQLLPVAVVPQLCLYEPQLGSPHSTLAPITPGGRCLHFLSPWQGCILMSAHPRSDVSVSWRQDVTHSFESIYSVPTQCGPVPRNTAGASPKSTHSSLRPSEVGS